MATIIERPSAPLRLWLEALKQRSIKIRRTKDRDDVMLVGAATRIEDLERLSRYRYALLGAWDHPDWWSSVYTGSQVEVDPPGRCAACGEDATAWDAETVPWCSRHEPRSLWVPESILEAEKDLVWITEALTGRVEFLREQTIWVPRSPRKLPRWKVGALVAYATSRTHLRVEPVPGGKPIKVYARRIWYATHQDRWDVPSFAVEPTSIAPGKMSVQYERIRLPGRNYDRTAGERRRIA